MTIESLSGSSPSRTFHVVTLGCAKNRADSEGMSTILEAKGYRSTDCSLDADVVVVNTCGFLGAARTESVQVLQELLASRPDGQRVVAAGCMPALLDYRGDLPPEVDSVLTTREWHRIGDVVGEFFGEIAQPETAGCEGLVTTFARAVDGPSAYVKIADGCDHACAFCTIPTIKGGQLSKRPLHVLQEVVDLVSRGAREVVFVSQDTIRYGSDIEMPEGLPALVGAVAEQIPDLPWLRLLYIYPSRRTIELIDCMAEHEVAVHYLDMPLQHADRNVLRRMKRPSDPRLVHRLLDHARTTMPDIALRTTFIVGFPGETDAAFNELLRFVEAEELDNVGVFTFSREPGTASYGLDDQVPAELAEERRGLLMEAQQAISLRKNRELIGRTLPVLIEAVGDLEDPLGGHEPVSVGRTYRQAPEVDGLVFVHGAHPTGAFVDVTFSDVSAYDLWGHELGKGGPDETRSAIERVEAVRHARRRRRASRSRKEIRLMPV